jgi:hypothetical protein
MKRLFYNYFAIIIYLGIGFFLTCIWTETVIALDWNVSNKILLSIMCACVIAFVECLRPLKEKRITITETEPIIWRILKLDNETDVNLLRDIQSVTKKKLLKSNRNKCIIQATKELCGKNCKCTSIKKTKTCTCGMFEEYVNYLIDEQTEN